MNKYLSFIAGTVWLAAGTMQAAPVETGLVARIHFAGANTVAADPNYAPVRNVWSSPEALALRLQTLDKLDRFLDGWLRQQIAPNFGNPIQVRPLLADLCDAEWQLDLNQPSEATAEFSLAVHLNNARTQAWQTTLTPLVEAWKKTSPAHHGQLARSGDWLFFQLGNSPVPAPAPAISPLKNTWLTSEVNWTRLATWFPGLRNVNLPASKLDVAGRNGKFEITGKLSLAQPLPPLERWQFPTNLIHSPVISVTAARGISVWLKQQPWVMSLGINPLPDEVFTWVMPQAPFQTYAAMPLAGAAGALPRLEQVLDGDLHNGDPNSPYRAFTITATNDEISLAGTPWIAPYIQAKHEPSGDFLLAGLFPNIARGRPAPPEFMARLGDPGVVYFDWENTSERLKIFPQLYQLLLVVSHHRQLDATSAAGHWLQVLQPALGQTATEVTETSPTELAFSRQGPAGLTAFELVAFASWLEAPNFPGCDLRMPLPKPRPHKPLAPNGPLPFTLHH